MRRFALLFALVAAAFSGSRAAAQDVHVGVDTRLEPIPLTHSSGDHGTL